MLVKIDISTMALTAPDKARPTDVFLSKIIPKNAPKEIAARRPHVSVDWIKGVGKNARGVEGVNSNARGVTRA